MPKFTVIKFVSRFFLVIILSVTFVGMFNSVHAMPLHASAAANHTHHSILSSLQKAPGNPIEHHQRSHDCDTCINCPCYSALPAQTIKFDYNPVVMSIRSIDSFQKLPKVFIPKFIPPRITA
jgi:hypothetical protein